jgi:hypothetical protein
MFKADQTRAKDRVDADVTLPRLDTQARASLSTTVARWDPQHHWVLG